MKHLLTIVFLFFAASAFAQTTDTLAINSIAVTDPNAFATTVNWVQISGPAATIVSPNSVSTVIRNIKEGTSVFRITAKNTYNASSYADITVLAVSNQAPVIVANPDKFKIILPAK